MERDEQIAIMKAAQARTTSPIQHFLDNPEVRRLLLAEPTTAPDKYSTYLPFG